MKAYLLQLNVIDTDGVMGYTYDVLQVWDLVSGVNCDISPLACAASSSMEDNKNGEDMFDTVYSKLREARI